jgi:coenzyme Q-binding protein COQ10
VPSTTSKRHVSHSAEQMFELVADVERYPEFLPFCEDLKILSRSGDVLKARMTVGHKNLHESYISDVTLNREALEISSISCQKPFKHLRNEWQFIPDESGSTIVFKLTYEFENKLLGIMMGALFDKVFSKFAEAFEKRADSLYR